MKIILFFIFAFCLPTIVFAQAEEALLQKVRAKLDKVTDYQASGKMKLDVSFINAAESDVIIYFKLVRLLK